MRNKTRNRCFYKNEVKHLTGVFPVWQGSFYREAVKLCGVEYGLGSVHLNILSAGMSLYVSGYRKNGVFAIDDITGLFPLGNINYSHYMTGLMCAGLLARLSKGKYIITPEGFDFINRFNKVLLDMQINNLKRQGVTIR